MEKNPNGFRRTSRPESYAGPQPTPPKIQKEAKSNPKLKPQVDELEKIKSILDNDTPLSGSGNKINEEYVQFLVRFFKRFVFVFKKIHKNLVHFVNGKQNLFFMIFFFQY